MSDFKAAIFDLDGTLLDSMWVWEKIDLDFLAGRNLTVPDEYFGKIASMTYREVAEYTIALLGLDKTVKEIMEKWNQTALRAYAHDVTLKPNAKEYLLSLKRRGVKLATATSLPRMLSEPALKNNSVYGLFDVFCSTDEVSRGKEHPDVYLLAAKKLNVQPADCIVFEDILPGIRAIIAAGMRPYGVYDRSSENDQVQIQALSEVYIRDFGEIL
ncbi:MAG: HAD family hydrolase [Bacillota bacterium]